MIDEENGTWNNNGKKLADSKVKGTTNSTLI